MRRLLFLDAFRGFFIVIVILTHAISHVVFWNAKLITMDEIKANPWVAIPFLPLILLGTWAPVFALISGIANTYSVATQVRQGTHSLGKLTTGMLINSGALYLVSLISMGIFHFGLNFNGQMRYSLLTGSLEKGQWRLPDPQILFYTDAIALVAMCGVILAGLFALLWRNGGIEKRTRNYTILIALGIGWFAVSPLLSRLEPLFFSALDNGEYIKASLLRLVVGPAHRTFPNAGFAVVGALFGMALADGAALRAIRRFGYGFGGLALGAGVSAMLVLGVPLGPEQIGVGLPLRIHLFNLGLMMSIVTFLIGLFDYGENARRMHWARSSTHLRRLGLLAMTVYICESLICVINMKWFVPLFVDAPLVARVCGVGLFGVMHLGIWHCLLRLWERIDFKYSFEWAVVSAVGALRRRPSARLRPALVLYVQPSAEAKRVA